MSQQNDQRTELEQPEWLKNHVPKPPKIGNPNWHKGMKSPNPDGRRATFGTARTKIAKMLQDSAGEILDVMIRKALEGDSAAAQLVLSRVVAPLRADSGRVKFPFDPEAPIPKQIEQVLAAVAAGEVSVDLGQQIITAVNALSQARVTEELAAEVAALKAKEVNG